MSASSSAALSRYDQDVCMYVTMRVDRQLFGIPVENVRDVLRQQHVTPIPLAPAEIDGSLNLRGRIVTVLNVRRRLGLTERDPTLKNMFVVVEQDRGDLYSLVVDAVGEVLTVPKVSVEPVPPNLTMAWKIVAEGIHKLPEELMVIMDVHKLLNL